MIKAYLSSVGEILRGDDNFIELFQSKAQEIINEYLRRNNVSVFVFSSTQRASSYIKISSKEFIAIDILQIYELYDYYMFLSFNWENEIEFDTAKRLYVRKLLELSSNHRVNSLFVQLYSCYGHNFLSNGTYGRSEFRVTNDKPITLQALDAIFHWVVLHEANHVLYQNDDDRIIEFRELILETIYNLLSEDMLGSGKYKRLLADPKFIEELTVDVYTFYVQLDRYGVNDLGKLYSSFSVMNAGRFGLTLTGSSRDLLNSALESEQVDYFERFDCLATCSCFY